MGKRDREGEGSRINLLYLLSFPYLEAVALLVDAEPKLLRNIKTVLEAAKKGQPYPITRTINHSPPINTLIPYRNMPQFNPITDCTCTTIPQGVQR